MAATYVDARPLRSHSPPPRRRIVVVGKGEKERRRARRDEGFEPEYRDVPDVEELRRSRAEYYERAPSERNSVRYRPMEQEVRREREPEKWSKRKGTVKYVDVREIRKVPREREREGSRRHRRRKVVEEDDYVYGNAPSRSGSRRMQEVREVRRGPYEEEQYRRDARGEEEDEGRVYTPRAPSPPPIQASPEKSSKMSRSSTKIGSGSHRTRSSTVRSRSRSRSRSVKMRKVKSRDARPPMPSVPEDVIPLSSPAKERRRGSFFGGFFAGRAKFDSPRYVECLTCASEVPSTKAAVLGCGHTMCHNCLKHIFTMSVTDPQHMPPRCCTSDHIPLKHVTKLFDDRFKSRWNKKFEEYTTKNRLYCPARGCGAWISPQEVRPSKIDQKRSIGVCRRCSTRVCGSCGRKWHTNADCSKLERDEDAREFVKMAAASGWQRCYNCTATVELKEGCNHMTCRCGAEFCMMCGSKWKSCDCPWFNASQLHDDDRLDMPNDIGRMRGGYAEDQARRRDQERRDEEVARRMQGLEIDDWENQPRGHVHREPRRARTPTGERTYGGNDTYGYGNMAGHFMNDNFVQRATRILTGAFNSESRDAASRLVQEIRTDRAPPLPRTAVVDPVRDQRYEEGRSRGAERSRPSSRRMASASEILDDAGVPTRRPSARKQRRDREQEQMDDRGGEEAEDRRTSVLAGLATRPGESRIEQWRHNVQEGQPEFGPA